MLEPPRVFLKSSFGYFSLESFNNTDFFSTVIHKHSELCKSDRSATYMEIQHCGVRVVCDSPEHLVP